MKTDEEINEKFDFFCEELKKIPIKKKKELLDKLQKLIFKKTPVRRF